jgi:hypothetical protein
MAKHVVSLHIIHLSEYDKNRCIAQQKALVFNMTPTGMKQNLAQISFPHRNQT